MDTTRFPIVSPPDDFGLSVGGLIGALLNEQSDLTAVDRFARENAGPRVESGPGPRVYASLLPTKPPGPGQQYAFEVDLDRCSGCKACVAACHALNGLDVDETWREVGLLVSGSSLPVLQHITTACHHCLDPACMSACPVDAYEKDPITGIVRHLDDQCFGCQYCTLACPYDVPKFHAGKGIVRKCDMCSDRLGAGKAPACAQGCPHQAIRIRVVDHAEVVAVAASHQFLPAAPDPGYTLPTTRYVGAFPRSSPVWAADAHRNEPEHAHWPLVVMLVLTQASAGGYAIDAASRLWGGPVPPTLSLLSLILGIVGIHASLLHLGRPRYAFRAVIGLRHSWLSREVAAFGLFGGAAAAATVSACWKPAWATSAAAVAALTGTLAVACSVMVYHAVRRPFWHAATTGPKFAGTALVLGLGLTLVATHGAHPVAWALIAATLAKLVLELSILTHLTDVRLSPSRKSAERLLGALRVPSALRLGAGVVGGVLLPLCALRGPAPFGIAVVAFAILGAGEIAERFLFFAAVVKPKMPGGAPS